jgi:hypothetical protein
MYNFSSNNAPLKPQGRDDNTEHLMRLFFESLCVRDQNINKKKWKILAEILSGKRL